MTSRDSRAARLHARVKEVFFQALDLEPGARPEFLERACPEAEVRRDVEELLADEGESTSFLSRAPYLGPGQFPRTTVPVLDLPREVAGYRVLDLLGWGGMGVVYLAEQPRLQRRVALKLLRQDCPDPLVAKRFVREAELQGRLVHPNIARVYDSGVAETETGRRLYTVLEHVPGRGLLEHLRETAADTRQVALLFAKLADAVQHAHEAGIVHRDLKPENVLVDPRGEPKVLDFGIACTHELEGELSWQTRSGLLVGTLAYMSPEQVRGAPATRASDQYALGAMLYEALSGRLPTESPDRLLGRDPRFAANAEARRLSEVAPDVPVDLQTIVHECLAVDPARRYASVGHLAEDLRRFLAGRPIHARRVTRLHQLARLVRRHRWASVGLCATILLLTSALLVTLAALREARFREEVARRLSDKALLAELEAEASELWPVAEDTLPAFRRWLALADELAGRYPLHVAALERLRRPSGTQADPDVALDSQPGSTRWLPEELVETLGAFLGEGGLAEEIAERARRAGALRARTVDAYAERWVAAAGAFADPTGPYAYPGRWFELAPRPGLVPLGPDPGSGLQEFALVATGDVPARDADGHLVQDPDQALVLVLIPGGPFWMGAQREDPTGTNYDRYAEAHEGPPRLVTLDPFLIGKYETTQAQWSRIMPENPSYWQAGEALDGIRVSPLHPVENMNRLHALEFCRRVGGALPTEAQWERAARGGRATPWWCGEDLQDVACRTNLKWAPDPGRIPRATPYSWNIHVPVGSYPPNPYGLHELIGNVSEFCLDGYKVRYFDEHLAEGDGLVLADGGGDWSRRGGGFTDFLMAGRSAHRMDGRAEHANGHTGFRLAFRIAPRGGWPEPPVDGSAKTLSAVTGRASLRSGATDREDWTEGRGSPASPRFP